MGLLCNTEYFLRVAGGCERVFKSWVTKIRYRKPCRSLILNQTQGSFQGKMNFPVCAIPDIQPCRCSCKWKILLYWLNRHCNALISETTPRVFWGKGHSKSNWPLCHPTKSVSEIWYMLFFYQTLISLCMHDFLLVVVLCSAHYRHSW